MITFHNFTDAEVEETLNKKEVPESILQKSEKTLCIFSQDWCPDWRAQLKDLQANEKSEENIFVAIFLYNNTKYQEKFMALKEDTWGNALIPYLRYYKNGKFIESTNQMPFQRILKVFEK